MSSEYVSHIAVTIPLAGVVGLFVGSFLNVVIYRTPLGLSVASPRSFYPTCDRQLLWWENIPVVSWLGLRGRCHTCHESISIRYPVVELVTGGTFALTAWAWDGTIVAAGYCVLAAAMIAVGLIEYGGQRAPLSVAAIGTGAAEAIFIAGAPLHQQWTVVFGSLVGSALALTAYGGLRSTDPAGTGHWAHGRSALLLAGCWAGGLGPLAALVGASGAIVAAAACMAASWALSRQTVTAGGGLLAPGHSVRSARPIVETPLVTAVVVAMVASLAVGVR